MRKLKRTSTRIISVGIPQDPRGLTKIVGGILSSTNSFSHNDDNQSIRKKIDEQSTLKSIDFGCIADYGSFYVDYDGKENMHIKDLEERFIDYYNSRKVKNLVFSDKDNSLVTFFLQLTRYLQQAIGTVAAIDLQAYLNTINEQIDNEL